MNTLLCATGNQTKYGIGKAVFSKHGIDLKQAILDIDEIQSENVVAIIEDKARKAFANLEEPVVVSDDSWAIPGLNGFPGPYMKSINHWFTPQNLIDLTHKLTDRRIYLNQLVTYYDGTALKTFRKDNLGELLQSPKGEYGIPLMKVVSLHADSGKSISQVYDSGRQHEDDRIVGDAWELLATWYGKAYL